MTLIQRFHTMSTRQQGSALLVTLMVIVGLSMLGLGFVAMSETESAISVNQRNYAQAQVISEAAARIITDWFNQPEQMNALGLMPTLAQHAALMRTRLVDTDGDGTADDIGKWKEGADFFCCDKPYRPSPVDRVYGTYWSPDVLIDQSTAEGRAFLTTLNDALFPVELDAGTPPRIIPISYSGEISEVRIYAPPIIGAVGTPNDANGAMPAGQGYYDEDPGVAGSRGVRYGLATIAVTAQVRRLPRELLTVSGNRVLSERTTRIVISEWPFPGPQGPIQSNANIQTGGSVVVHWGKMTSQGNMEVKREFQGLPWLDAHQIIPWWYGGNDTSREWQGGTQVQLKDVIRPTDAATALLHNYFAASCSSSPCVTGGTEPIWPTSGSIVDGNVTWTRRNPARFKVVTASGDPDYPINKWGDEILGRSFEDPWVQARARQAITNAPNTDPEPFKWNFADLTKTSITSPIPKKSHWTQFQDHTETAPSSYKEVVFPKIDYNFWKELAIAGQGTEGVFYFRWVANDTFSRNGVVNTFKAWTNTATGAEPGFYFFDTRNSQNPQVAGGEVFLTPAIDITSAGGNTWTASGFIYVNTETYGSQGITGVEGYFNFPGDLYLDQGFIDVDETATPMVSLGVEFPGSVGNRQWDYEDLNSNGTFDLWIEAHDVKRLDGTVATVWQPVQWYEGCNILDNANSPVACVSGNCCSEPHEPYLNIQYPTRTESGVLIGDACCAGLLPNELTIGWYPNNLVDRLPKKKLPVTDALPDCTGGDFNTWDTRGRSKEYCTSNYFDRNGAFDLWDGQMAPILNGVMYVEGTMESQGDGVYFGSLLINGNVKNKGTNEVWFDERLVKDEWPPSDWPFPRVFISAVRTDDL